MIDRTAALATAPGGGDHDPDRCASSGSTGSRSSWRCSPAPRLALTAFGARPALATLAAAGALVVVYERATPKPDLRSYDSAPDAVKQIFAIHGVRAVCLGHTHRPSGAWEIDERGRAALLRQQRGVVPGVPGRALHGAGAPPAAAPSAHERRRRSPGRALRGGTATCSSPRPGLRRRARARPIPSPSISSCSQVAPLLPTVSWDTTSNPRPFMQLGQASRPSGVGTVPPPTCGKRPNS